MPHIYDPPGVCKACSRFVCLKGACDPPSAMVKGPFSTMPGNLSEMTSMASCTWVWKLKLWASFSPPASSITRPLLRPSVASGGADVRAWTIDFGLPLPLGGMAAGARVEAAGGSGRGQDWAKPAVTNKRREPERAQARSRASSNPARATHNVVTLTCPDWAKPAALKTPCLRAARNASAMRVVRINFADWAKPAVMLSESILRTGLSPRSC